MLNLQKSAFDQTGSWCDFFSPIIVTSSSNVFVPPANNVEIENNDVKNELTSEDVDRKSTRLNSSHERRSRMPSSA